MDEPLVDRFWVAPSTKQSSGLSFHLRGKAVVSHDSSNFFSTLSSDRTTNHHLETCLPSRCLKRSFHRKSICSYAMFASIVIAPSGPYAAFLKGGFHRGCVSGGMLRTPRKF